MLFSGTYIQYKNNFYIGRMIIPKKEFAIHNPGFGSTPFVKNILFSDIEKIFNVRVWVDIRGCSAIWKGFQDKDVRLGVHPKDSVKLESKQIERGVFESLLPKKEITRMWEERYEWGDLSFPNGLDRVKEIDLKEVPGYF